jgi:flavin reductase (DIM6/NTAB) family NADH-FMN oxidoreductase RutF
LRLKLERVDFNFADLPTKDRYKLLVGAIVPRPIAWVSTLNENASVNLAPFSAFNYMGDDPGVIAFSPHPSKHTFQNVEREGEFVVNLVTHALSEAMNVTAIDFPAGVSELEHIGVTTAPSIQIRTPRVNESPVNLECRVHTIVPIGNTRVVVAQVLHYHIKDEFLNREKMYVNTLELDLIGRFGGTSQYVTMRESFSVPRVTYQQWLERSGEGKT